MLCVTFGCHRCLLRRMVQGNREGGGVQMDAYGGLCTIWCWPKERLRGKRTAEKDRDGTTGGWMKALFPMSPTSRAACALCAHWGCGIKWDVACCLGAGPLWGKTVNPVCS